MKSKIAIIPLERVENVILFIRRQRVMLDVDLAKLYGVTTKRLNEQVKRNRERFPEDFMFQLTLEEKAEVVANCDHLYRLKFSPALPYAPTEHGAERSYGMPLDLSSLQKAVSSLERAIKVANAVIDDAVDTDEEEVPHWVLRRVDP